MRCLLGCMRITKTGHAQFPLRVEKSVGVKLHPGLGILMRPKAGYAGTDILLKCFITI